jgi:hypothetical protein
MYKKLYFFLIQFGERSAVQLSIIDAGKSMCNAGFGLRQAFARPAFLMLCA